MKPMWMKRILCLVLCFGMVLGYLPAAVLAEEPAGETIVLAEETTEEPVEETVEKIPEEPTIENVAPPTEDTTWESEEETGKQPTEEPAADPAEEVPEEIPPEQETLVVEDMYAGSACQHTFTGGACSQCGILGGSCGEKAYWALEEATGLLTIYGEGDMHYDVSPWQGYDSAIKSVVVEHGVTSIRYSSFENLYTNITSVTLPDTLERIEHDAFFGCSGLTEIVIPQSVTMIEYRAFLFCNNMQAFHVDPENTAFTSIDGVLYTKDLSELLYYPMARGGELIIPDETTTISCSFDNCINLTSVVFHDSVTQITSFTGCENLESVILPDSLESMPMHVFGSCKKLRSIDIPEGVSVLPVGAFGGCSELTSVNLPDSLIELDDSAFVECRSLASIDIPDSVLRIGRNTFARCSALTEISIPDSVQIIGESSFNGCTGLEEIVIPYGVVAIFDNAFGFCNNLKTITIPASIEIIYHSTFYNCNSLRQVIYTGNESQWNEIDIRKGNDALNKATIQCMGTESKNNPVIDNNVSLAEGNHASWIDRVVLPSFAQEYYNWLVESTDGDGWKDELLRDNISIYYYKAIIPVTAKSYEELVVKLDRECYAAIEAITITHNIFRHEYPDIAAELFRNVYAVTHNKEKLSDTEARIEIEFGIYIQTDFVVEEYFATVDAQESAINNILSLIPEDATRYDQIRLFNAYLTRSNCFNSEYPSEYAEAHRAITALTGKTGAEGPVCESYAKAFRLLCKARNIPCAYISGKANGGDHGWNVVQMEDGKWYAVDVTWNDPSISGVTDAVSGYESEDYLLVGSKTVVRNKRFSDSHIADEEHVTNTAFDLPNGPVLSETVYVPDEVSEHIEVNSWVKKPNCSENGIMKKSCYICGELTSDEEVEVPATGLHSIKNGACQYCGAYGGNCGQDMYWLLNDAGLLTISGSGSMDVYSKKVKAPWNSYASNITNISIGDGVSTISDYAFEQSVNLLGVTIPDSVVSIGKGSFTGCSSIEKIPIPNSVKEIGPEAFSECAKLQSIVIPPNVTKINDRTFMNCKALTDVSILGEITHIGSQAFWGCDTGLTSIVLPESISAIGDRAFGQCKKLSGISLPDGVAEIGEYAFYQCASLMEIEIPNGLAAISENTFSNCTGLTTIVIPETIIKIGRYAFIGCKGLTSIWFEGDAPEIGTSAFANVAATVYYPSDNETWTGDVIQNYGGNLMWNPIGECIHCFADGKCEACGILGGSCGEKLNWTLNEEGILTIYGTGKMYNHYRWDGNTALIHTVRIEPGITEIGYSAFMNCSNLREIAIPDGVTAINDSAFSKCSSLKEIVLPKSVKRIGASAFSGCSSLVEFEIPENVPRVENSVFYGCSSLLKIKISQNISSIGNNAFTNCKNLVEVPIPKSVTNIGSYAFYNCGSLKRIVIPEGVTSIQGQTFYNCSNLTEVVIPESVIKIEEQAFYNCSSLTEIVIPEKLTTIEREAFCHCSGLKIIIFKGSYPKIGSFAFAGNNATVYYPADNTTWTEDKLQNSYGGTITWKAACTEEHPYGNWQITKAATVTAEGQEQRECLLCGEEQTRSLIPVQLTASVEPAKVAAGAKPEDVAIGLSASLAIGGAAVTDLELEYIITDESGREVTLEQALATPGEYTITPVPKK